MKDRVRPATYRSWQGQNYFQDKPRTGRYGQTRTYTRYRKPRSAGLLYFTDRPEPVIQKAILIARKVFALPTLSEVLHEVVLGIDNRAIHLGKPRHC